MHRDFQLFLYWETNSDEPRWKGFCQPAFEIVGFDAISTALQIRLLSDDHTHFDIIDEVVRKTQEILAFKNHGVRTTAKINIHLATLPSERSVFEMKPDQLIYARQIPLSQSELTNIRQYFLKKLEEIYPTPTSLEGVRWTSRPGPARPLAQLQENGIIIAEQG